MKLERGESMEIVGDSYHVEYQRFKPLAYLFEWLFKPVAKGQGTTITFSQSTVKKVELKQKIEDIIKQTKLPDPNPYGQWVRVKNVNKILDQLAKTIKKL